MSSLCDRGGYSVVSLGFFCSVALENERIGIRDCSLPFDWLIAGDFERVLWLIENDFKDFLLEENLYQEYYIDPNYYYDCESKVHFYHDFLHNIPLRNQYNSVKDKYNRRIKRFYKVISQPTLFVRYCSGGEKELNYIKKNREEILNILRRYNPNNEIIYIYTGNKNEQVDDGIFCVEADKNDGVARVYLNKLPQLESFLLDKSVLTEKEINDNAEKARIKNRFSDFKKLLKKIRSRLAGKLRIAYYHDKQYSDLLK